MDDIPVGQAALISRLDLQVPMPVVTSVVGSGIRKTVVIEGRAVNKYTPTYKPDDTIAGHLKFALRYEPLDFIVLAHVFQCAVAADSLRDWIKAEPGGLYARRAWFLYEWFTGQVLDIPDCTTGAYVDALDPSRHVTATTAYASRRHRVRDNILGVPGFAPVVRLTSTIDAFAAQSLDLEARRLLDSCDPVILARAVNYLYTKETMSSFAIESEVPTARRAERFVAALHAARLFDATQKDSLVQLQNIIVDPRYAATGFRDFQNFVGENHHGIREEIHFICPRPQDVEPLMQHWAGMVKRLRAGGDPVISAALIAFGFVFIHPFEDGNGRIHRFLLHQVLASGNFTPPDMLFPVSAAIVRDRHGYSTALEGFSKRILPFIEWHWTPDKEIAVDNDTAAFYGYFDATPLVEFLYAKIAETIRVDLKEELGFVAVFDAAFEAVRTIVDMPDRRASLLIQLCMQNNGKLSAKKRATFSELTDREVAAIEAAIWSEMQTQGTSPE